MDRRIDRALDGPRWLENPRIARIVVETMQAGEQEREFYRLRAWVVMPNHVHVLWGPRREMRVITRWVKGCTARRANLLLGRTGRAFWQDESYDHWVRQPEELEKIVRYIERNPVQAGLVKVPKDWRWSSAWQAKTPAPQKH
jgi:type I restriction enzyme R subunit/putative DNA methylase